MDHPFDHQLKLLLFPKAWVQNIPRVCSQNSERISNVGVVQRSKKAGVVVEGSSPNMGKCSSIFSLTHIFEMGGSTNHQLARFLDGIFRFSPIDNVDC